MAPFVSDVCRTWFYQPKEPDGFNDFVIQVNKMNSFDKNLDKE